MITNNGGLDSLLNESKMDFKRGQRIKFMDGDKIKVGKYVMASSADGYIVLNMGGKYVTPKVVPVDKVVTHDYGNSAVNALRRATNMPEYNKQYALTGGPKDKCIMNGNTQAESEARFTLIEDRLWDKDDPKIIEHFTGTENECLEWIHKHTTFSITEAIKNQGYKIIKK